MQSKIVHLRNFTKDDVNQYYSIAQDKSEYFPFGYCRNKKDAKDIIDSFINSLDLNAKAVINGQDKIVGAILLEYQKEKIQVSYFIGIQYRRRGYCSQAIRIVEQIAKNKNIKIIEFCICKSNICSMLLAEKIGAKKVKRYNNDFIILQKCI